MELFAATLAELFSDAVSSDRTHAYVETAPAWSTASQEPTANGADMKDA